MCIVCLSQRGVHAAQGIPLVRHLVYWWILQTCPVTNHLCDRDACVQLHNSYMYFMVTILGSTAGLDHTLTQGIVSGDDAKPFLT